MSDDKNYYQGRLLEELLILITERRFFVDDYVKRYNYSKKTIYRDIKILREVIDLKFGDDVSLIYNRTDGCYELLVLKGSISIIDLPYGF